MARVLFTPNLRRHLACEPRVVSGGTVAAALEAVFDDHPALRGYVVDEHGRLRKHVAVFVDGYQIRDRIGLSDPVTEGSEIYVAQALSGG